MPHDAALLRQLATQEMNARQFSEAARFYQDVLQESIRTISNPGICWDTPRLSRAIWKSARKSFERYGSDPAHAANALDSAGRSVLFSNGKFAEAEKYFLEAHAKSSALLRGDDLLKAAYSHWLQGDLPGADQQFAQYVAFRSQQKDPVLVRGARPFGNTPRAARTRL